MKKALLVIMLFASSCHPISGPDKTFAGAILGAGWGAGAGAVIGHQFNQTGPGVAIGSGFGAAAGLLTGLGYDLGEETDIDQNRELDALRVQIASNQRTLMLLQDALDDRDRKINMTSTATQVFFDESRASLRSGSIGQLERLADAIKQNPYVGHVDLYGHSDGSKEPEKDKQLSEARARTVATFLANRGVPLDEINIFAQGTERPLATNDTEAGRQLNRRVEIVLRK